METTAYILILVWGVLNAMSAMSISSNRPGTALSLLLVGAGLITFGVLCLVQ